MHHSKSPYIEYDPRRRTHVMVKIAFVLIAVAVIAGAVRLVEGSSNNDGYRHITGVARDRLPREVSMDKVLRTRFFNVVVDTALVYDSVKDRKAVINLPNEPGNQYIVINISFKNTDNESKMIPDGELAINSGNNEIKYSKPEPLIKKGWGLLMENIEPGITRKTRIVYKIPAGISGKAYYYPDISYSQDRIFLADFDQSVSKSSQ